MMKSSIPRNCASTRDETGWPRAGRGGRRSWATWPAATEADSIRLGLARCTTCSTGLPVEASHPPDQVAAQPARARLGEGRDHDVVRRVELERVLDRRERVGVHHLADRPRARVLELLRACAPGARAASPRRRRRRSDCGHDHDEAARLLARPSRFSSVEQLARRRRSGWPPRACASRRRARRRGPPPRARRDAAWRAPTRSIRSCAQPAGARLGVGGDDDLVVVRARRGRPSIAA